MLYVYPDFYPEFKCTADRCAHSCCRGWEIDIDDDAMELYAGIDGEFGERLRACIDTDPTPHFILGADEACPFLRGDGLCEMILTLGEDSLCDICALHPRFFNERDGRLEAGLGLCCEEAVRLLLEKDVPLGFIYDGDCGAVPREIALRDEALGLLADSTKPLSERMNSALSLVGQKPLDTDTRKLAAFYKTLERMEDKWGAMLNTLENSTQTVPPPDGIEYERLAEYFVYRHFTDISGAALRFAFVSVLMINALAAVTGEPLCECVRLYSAEIEYSDENVGVITEYINDSAG